MIAVSTAPVPGGTCFSYDENAYGNGAMYAPKRAMPMYTAIIASPAIESTLFRSRWRLYRNSFDRTASSPRTSSLEYGSKTPRKYRHPYDARYGAATIAAR